MPLWPPVLALAAAAAIVAVVVIALPQRSDERERQVTSTTVTYRVGHLGDSIAKTMRARLAAFGLPDARVEVAGERMSITAPIDVTPLTVGGNLNIFDFERSRIGGPEPVSLEEAQARNGLPILAEDGRGYYALRDQVALFNNDIAGAAASRDPMTDEPVVLVQLRPEAQERFRELTRTLAQRGTPDDLQHMAITIDLRIVSMPYIDGRYAPDGIDGAEGLHISVAGMTELQARELAAVLDGGPIPIELRKD